MPLYALQVQVLMHAYVCYICLLKISQLVYAAETAKCRQLMIVAIMYIIYSGINLIRTYTVKTVRYFITIIILMFIMFNIQDALIQLHYQSTNADDAWENGDHRHSSWNDRPIESAGMCPFLAQLTPAQLSIIYSGPLGVFLRNLVLSVCLYLFVCLLTVKPVS